MLAVILHFALKKRSENNEAKAFRRQVSGKKENIYTFRKVFLTQFTARSSFFGMLPRGEGFPGSLYNTSCTTLKECVKLSIDITEVNLLLDVKASLIGVAVKRIVG